MVDDPALWNESTADQAGPDDRSAQAPVIGVPPAEINAFIGRHAETALVRKLLHERRLVTVKGSAGIGKTRFVEHLAGVVEEDFGDGVVLVPLADVRAAGLDSELARALDLVDNGAGPAATQLMRYLQGKQVLLVLDNCEHLVEHPDDADEPGPLPQLVRRLLRVAKNLRVVATSRLALGISGEQVVDLGPLPYLVDGSNCGEPEAMQLLRDRLEAKGKPLQPEHLRYAQEVCQLLEGVPHAIEMVAALRRHKTWAELVRGLRATLTLLAQGRLPEVDQWHHRSLHASMQLTYKLLDEPTRHLWSVLSVFTGVFDLDAVRHVSALVCGDDCDVEPALETLVDHSVLIHSELDDRSQWKMLPTDRAFGLYADSEVATRARVAHADYYAQWIEESAKRYYGPHEVELLRAVIAAMPNIRTAVETLTATGRAERALRLLIDLSDCRANTFTGGLRELRRLMMTCLQALGDQVLPVMVECMASGAFAALLQGDGPDAARAVLDRCREMLHQLPTGESATTRAAQELEWAEATELWLAEPDPTVAIRSIEVLRRLAAAEPDRGRRHMRNLFAGLAAGFYRHDDALGLAQAHLEDTRSAGAPWAVSWAEWLMALVIYSGGHDDLDKALALLKASLRSQHGMGDRWGPPWTLWLMGLVAGARGEHTLAAQLLGGAWAQQQAISTDITNLLPFQRLQQPMIDSCVARLGATTWNQEADEGSLLPLDDLVEIALSVPEQDGVVRKQETPAGLTPREFEALLRLAADYPKTNQEMANRMHCGKRTFETYLQEIRRKTGITDRYELAKYGQKWLAGNPLDGFTKGTTAPAAPRSHG